MKLGLVGFPQVGKRTLFMLLTGQHVNGDQGRKEIIGLAKVRDSRFDRLVRLYSPKKETPAHLEFVLLPDLDNLGNRNASLFQDLAHVDVICHMVRAFQDETVFHVHGSINPGRDFLFFLGELQLNDLIFIEKRLERIKKEYPRLKEKKKADAETDLLIRLKELLEGNRFLRSFPFTEEEKKLIAGYPFLTRKPLILMLNVGEEDLKHPERISGLTKAFSEEDFHWSAVSAKIEQEISLLEGEERAEFLRALDIDQPALDQLTLLCFHTLGLISFFTVGPDEVRAWIIPQGSLAPYAGGAIHSDIQRGFIRAEIMKYDDLFELGSEQKIKEAGKFMQKGKDYRVEDGDIINFLFNV
jgi:GTP-binding protein YchF